MARIVHPARRLVNVLLGGMVGAMRTGPVAVVAVLTALAAVPALGPSPSAAGPEQAVILLYPSYLTWDPHGKTWNGTIEGRVKEAGPGSRVARAALRSTLGMVVSPAKEEEPIFEERVSPFASAPKRGERIIVTVGARSWLSEPSKASGRFAVEVALAEGTSGAEVPFRARLGREGAGEVEGTVRLLGAAGVSVISDIDDTVKDTDVLDRRELVANTFYRPYRAVSGMPGLYAAWRGKDVPIHYVTASPWQLFPPLWSFLTESGIAGVSIEMREVRAKNGSVVKLFRGSRDFKTGRIREILRRFPERTFVLVGDSGERDPEIYAAIAREHPGQVRGIFIRAIDPGRLERRRCQEAFAGIPEARWIVFDDPEALPRDLAAWARGESVP
jgi:hypothetical protein